MSPTGLTINGFRLYVFSREERRMHVHVHHAEGEAKFWLDPKVELSQSYRLSARRLTAARWVIRKHEGQIRAAWQKHFDR